MSTTSAHPSHPTGWLSYDSVADTYQRVAVPWFTALAHDLVAVLAPSKGESILDVGTGTGLVARSILDRAICSVIGADPSRGMVARVPRHDWLRLAVAMAPGLPFASGRFDAVVANLVLSHLPDPHAGLADMVRVLHAGGRLACTAWTAPDPPGPDNQRPDADEIVEVITKEFGFIWTPRQDAVPLEEWFREPDHLREALNEAGLTDVAVSRHTYRWTFTVDEYLAGWGSRGRYIRHRAGKRRWNEYSHRASDALRDRFGDKIGIVNSAWIATAGRR